MNLYIFKTELPKKRKTSQPQYKTIKVRKLNSCSRFHKQKTSSIVKIDIDDDDILKQIILVEKTGYYLSLVIFTLEKEIIFEKEINFSQSTRNLREHKIHYCDSISNLISQFYCYLINNKLKHIITYDHEIDNHLQLNNITYVQDYLKQSYFLRSYELNDISFLFLNKKHTTSIEECLHVAELTYLI
jgi:hypothetical protein